MSFNNKSIIISSIHPSIRPSIYLSIHLIDLFIYESYRHLLIKIM